MLKIIGLDHLVLRTAQLPALLQFYVGKLGCQLERELPELGLVQLRIGAHLLDLVDVNKPLGQQGGAPAIGAGRNLDHFCIQVSASQSELTEWLQENQFPCEFAERYGARGFGSSVYIEDPDGNIVELRPT